ncbi:HAD family hydrolase [Halopiger goleimassiliensis]|uniref:HAD family hydrolase n=1 Tax=Halopiger goleimassiliensis TaxID=1293048 RepID=UPI0006779022|nr:HAD-IA family hydrolase [Halopiger goleimassiliensis]
MPTPVLFDMDGVILEGPGTVPGTYADAADAALADLGVDPTPAQRDSLRQHGLEGVRDCCTALGIDPDEFWRRKERHASVRTHDRLRSGERGRYEDSDVIHDVTERTTTALVSNNRHETTTFVAEFYDFPFDAVRGRDPTLEGFRRRKPDPYYLERTLADLGLEDGIYVGDKPKDVVAGREAGLETAFVRRPHNRDVELPEGTTYELESLWTVPDLLEE